MNFLEEENKLLKNKQVDMENCDKRSNLVFHGIAESVEDLEAEFHRLCTHYLKLSEQLRIERIHRVGSPNKDRPRTVVVKFLSYKDRELFWNNRRNLKGSRVFVEEHFAVEIQQQRLQLLPYMQAARQRGEKAILIGDKLLISG